MEGIPHPIPRTVEEVFQDFKGRRAGLIKALTNGTLLFSAFFFFFVFVGFRFFFFFFFLQILLIRFFGVEFADVEKFYQQCDPGGSFLNSYTSSSSFFFFF
jgi:hypothetical protein